MKSAKTPKSPESKPAWNKALRELRLDGRIAKRFRQPAPLQERILQEFEEFGWPEVIEDPLPPEPEQEPKERLHNTIKNLNRGLKRLHFEGTGTGEHIRWRRR